MEDAEALFLQGLFEIQRAYNLSDKFEDRGGADKRACASGTFNKFVEKLVGVHPDAELKYITPQGAIFKLLPLIREASKNYLVKTEVEDLTVEALKEVIQPGVREQLLFEFGNTLELTVLTGPYENFEVLQDSDDYVAFQALLQQRQDEGLEQMVEGKLLVADEALDEELTEILEAEREKKSATEEVKEELDEKNLTKEALREARLRFFEEEKEPDKNQPNGPDKRETPGKTRASGCS